MKKLFTILLINVFVFSSLVPAKADIQSDIGFVRIESYSSLPNEGGFVEVTVRFFRRSTGDASIRYHTQDGSAEAPSDYEAKSGDLIWGGDTEGTKTFFVLVEDDEISEGNETFSIILTDPSSGLSIDSRPFHVQIRDDDDGIAFLNSEIDIEEDGGIATVSVVRVGNISEAVQVEYTTEDGTAIAGQDYQTRSGLLQWGAGNASIRNINIPILDEGIGELAESFYVNLYNPSDNTTVATNNPARIVIAENDRHIRLVNTEIRVQEDDPSGIVRIPIERTGDFSGTARVHYITQGGGFIHEDKSGFVEWGNNVGGVDYIEINLINNTSASDFEHSFVVQIWDAEGARIEGPTHVRVIVEEDDTAVRFDVPDNIFHHENHPTGKFSVTVIRVGNPRLPMTVDLETDNYFEGATPDVDYVRASETISWGANDKSERAFEFEVIDDVESESGEMFAIRLSNPSIGYLTWPAYRDITILDDENVSNGVFTIGSGWTLDETSNNFWVSVDRTDGLTGTVRVDYHTENDSAIAGTHYESTSGTLEWAEGDTDLKSFEINIIDNDIIDGDKTFRVVLSNPQGGASLHPDRHTADFTIEDNDIDPAGVLSFEENQIGVFEGESQAFFTIKRERGTSGNIRVEIITVDGTAKAGRDYSPFCFPIGWGNDHDQDFVMSVHLFNDNENTGDRSFTVELRDPTNNATLGATRTLNITIFDVDPTNPGYFSFQEPGNGVLETIGTTEILVDRRGGSMGAVQVFYETRNRTAIAGSDYTSTSGFLTWAEGETGPRPISVDILDIDIENEDREELEIILSQPSPGTFIQTPEPYILAIVDDDNINPGSISLKSGFGTLVSREDEREARVVLERTGGVDGWVDVHFEFEDGTAVGGLDYSKDVATFRIMDGEIGEKVFDVELIDDSVPEEDKNFSMRITGITNEFGTGDVVTPDSLEVVIRNDDLPALDLPAELSVLVGEEIIVSVAPNPPLSTLSTVWSLDSGPSEPQIDSPDLLTTRMRFTHPGLHTILLSGSVGLGFRRAGTFNVNVGSPALAPLAPSVNMFNASIGEEAVINYQMETPGQVKISIYDRFGRETIELLNQFVGRSNGSKRWDGRDSSGEIVAPGVYIAVIKENGSSRNLKIIALR